MSTSGGAHRVTVSSTLWAFAGLLVLATASLLLSFAPLGALALPVALAIATVKAALVAMFFMHLIENRATPRIALAVCLVLGAIVVSLTTVDLLEESVRAHHATPPQLASHAAVMHPTTQGGAR